MASRNKPRSGSLGFKPMKRAKNESARIRSWPESKEVGILGFAGYKAGMTNVIAVDNRKSSPTTGMEVFVPVTVIEVPPLVVAAIRVYKKGYNGKAAVSDVWAKELAGEVQKRVTVAKKRDPEKKLAELEKNLEAFSDVRLLVHTQPKLTSMPKKTPDLLEIALGGNVAEKFEYAKGLLGKEVAVEDAVSQNSFVDVVAVSKGKGFAGVIKRYGVKIQPRKAGKGRRHIGTGGAWTPARKMWREPLPGKMGYNKRTEYNKAVLKVGKEPSEVNPAGGFLRYGPVNNSYILLKGSVPGPAKRLIRFTQPKRAQGEPNFDITHINVASKQGA